MKTFTEFLMEATAPKKISFNSYVKDMFKTLSSIKDFSVSRKLSITSGKKESANFRIHRYLGTISEFKDTKDRDIQKFEFKKQHDKILQSILLILNCPPTTAKSNKMYDTKYTSRGINEICDVTFTDKKSGYQITVISELEDSFGSISSIFDFQFEGNEIDQKGLTFTEFPNMIPGAILHSSWGYSMTINTFYEIVRRTNKTVYAVEVGNKKVDGDGWTGHEIPDISKKDKEVFSGRISPNGTVKLDGHYCTIYDGKPKYYNQLD